MKKNLHIYCVVILLIISVKSLIAQQVLIDDSIPLEELIENNLAGSCVEISNVISSVNGSVDGLNSYGAFQRGSSNFPLENGIVISSGDVASGGNIANNTDLSEGTVTWGTETDI